MDANSDFLIDLALRGGPIGIVLAISVVVIGYLAKGRLTSLFTSSGTANDVLDFQNSVAEKLDVIDDKVKEIERELENRPTRDNYHELELSMSKMNGRIDRQGDALKRIEGSVLRMEDFLLRYDKEKGT